LSDDKFYRDIERFNALYRLPGNERPTLLGPERVRSFHAILSEEVEEGLDLAKRYEELNNGADPLPRDAALDVLTELSDWLGDLVVYCASEARRWGIALPEVLGVIMESNFSKLGADGQPIYDDRGKVMKGPNYWKPEPRLKAQLEAKLRSRRDAGSPVEATAE
jgi:predicted HAD superfamily Cof-like phosphohydrolase